MGGGRIAGAPRCRARPGAHAVRPARVDWSLCWACSMTMARMITAPLTTDCQKVEHPDEHQAVGEEPDDERSHHGADDRAATAAQGGSTSTAAAMALSS